MIPSELGRPGQGAGRGPGGPPHIIFVFALLLLPICAFAQAPPQGIITTIAGDGVQGFNGDDQPASSARLNFELGDADADQEDIIQLSVDVSGNIFFPDRGNNRIRRIAPNGVITTVAGNGLHSFGGDGGLATAAALDWPAAVVSDAAGNLYIADQHNNRIRRVERTSGMISTFAGSGLHSFSGNGGQARAAALDYPTGLLLDAAGNLYISDQHNAQVRRVRTTGIIEAFAGTGLAEFSGDGGPAVRAAIDWPTGLAVDAAGNIYISDPFNNRIRRVTPDGNINTFAGDGREAFAGDGGPANRASVNHPSGVAVDAAGNVYIADQYNNRIRRVAPDGIITTIAGTGAAAFGGDNGPALQASLNHPSGIAVDSAGNLYIADHINQRVRKITFPRPVAGGVTNAASFATGSIAPGEIVSLFGTSLGPATGVGAEVDSTGKLATTRAGVTVLFNDVPGALFFVRQDQINVQAPYELTGQTSARIVVQYQGAVSPAATVAVTPAAPGIFAVRAGTGQAAMLNQDFSVNSAANPAARGSVVQIYLTGQGATQPAGVTGQLTRDPFPAPVLPVNVTIGGRPARTAFVGLAPGFAGLLQINAFVPDDVNPGDATPLVVTVGQVASQAGVTLAVR
jgi:uncharacterized protein (TIGR03437 family)